MMFKKWYFIKCHVSGKFKTNEGDKVIYFILKERPKKLDKKIDTYCSVNKYDLIEILQVVKL